MSDTEFAEFSLAELADVDVSGIEEFRFETLPQGVYDFEIVEAGVTEGKNKDDEARFEVAITYKILEVKTVLQPNVDKEALVGKTITDKQFIKKGQEPQKLAEAIGRVKATVLDVGGTWGKNIIENVQNIKGLMPTGKITHQADKDDKSVIYARVKFEPKK